MLLDVFTSTTEPEIKMYIAWIFGTSVQNNETAQKDVSINILNEIKVIINIRRSIFNIYIYFFYFYIYILLYENNSLLIMVFFNQYLIH